MQGQIGIGAAIQRLAVCQHYVDRACGRRGDDLVAMHRIAHLKNPDRTVRSRGFRFPYHRRHRSDHFACRSHLSLPFWFACLRAPFARLTSPFWRGKRQRVSVRSTGTLVMFASYLTGKISRKSRNSPLGGTPVPSEEKTHIGRARRQCELCPPRKITT